jgi:hypothetical protein
LGDQEIVDIDAELLGIARVERMLGIDEGAGAALALRLGHDMQRQRGLARALGPVDLDDAALGQAADPQRNVESQRAGRDRLDLQRLALAELHDRALAEGALDLGESRVQRLVLVLHAVLRIDHFQNCRHWLSPRCPTPLSGAANADKSAAGSCQCTYFVPTSKGITKPLILKHLLTQVLGMFW